MLRPCIAVFVGFLVTGGLVSVVMGSAVLVLDIDTIYEPDSYQASTLWIVASLVLGVAAAFLGGVTARAIAREHNAVRALAVVILVLGGMRVLNEVNDDRPDPPARPKNASLQDIAEHSRQPVYITVMNPLLGAAGVFLGGAFIARRQTDTP